MARGASGHRLGIPAATRPPAVQRLAAALALLAGAASVVVLVVASAERFPAGLLAIGAALLAVALAWLAATRRGALRGLALAGVLLALAGIVVVLVWRDAVLGLVVAGGLALLCAAGARAAQPAARAGGDGCLAARASGGGGQPAARGGGAGGRAAAGVAGADARARRVRPGRATRGVLLMNPRSGGGKVQRFDLPREARARGIEPLLLEPGDDLRRLALDAVARGADMLGMAGGDGSQAIVSAVASEHELPYACIPAGTRNHLALDLGVDRDDVVGALDAYVDGLERRIDLASAGGRVFVNNVSLGLYAEVVQSDRYRDAKLRTTADVLPDLLGPDAPDFDLRFDAPGGARDRSAQLVLVSNNPYRLDRLLGLGSRPRLDTGQLGIVALTIAGAHEASAFAALEAAGRAHRFAGWSEWTAPHFEVRASGDVPAGVDGETLTLAPPLHFHALPGALRVRIAPQHPGRSPAALRSGPSREAIAQLARLALRGAQPSRSTVATSTGTASRSRSSTTSSPSSR
jgi:diacylglycerol kinase family enzyme